MGSQHLDYWCPPLKYKTIIKLTGISMKNNQDNEKQMVPLEQKISTATLQSFLTSYNVHSSAVNSSVSGMGGIG